MEILNFGKLLGLERLVTDIFETCGFSEPVCKCDGLVYKRESSVVPGQEKTILCHVTCFDDDRDLKKFRRELGFRSNYWNTGRVFDRRTKSYILATEELATDEDQIALLKLSEHVGIQGFIWDRVELTRLLLNVVPDSLFVISRNFSDYGGELLAEVIESANDKATTLKDLAPHKAATIFADLFKDCKDPLEAWLVFDMLHQPYSEMTHTVADNLYNYVVTLAKFQCKPLNQSLTRTLSEVLSYSHCDEITRTIANSTRSSYEDGEMDDYKIDTARLVRNADSFHLVFDVTANLSCLAYNSKEFTSVTAVIKEDDVEIQE